MEVGGAELTIYDNIDAKTGERAWCDLCRGPHVPDHARDPGVQAHALRRGVLARRREEPAAAAHLRHRVGEQRRAQGAPRRSSTRPSAATTAGSAPSSTCSRFPDEIGSGLAVFHPKGGVDPPGDGGLLAAAPRRGGLRVRQHPAHHQGGAVRDLRAPRLVRRGHVPAHGPRRGVRRRRRGQAGRAEVLPEADELPDAQPDLRRARPVLPRAAAAAVRVRHRLPLREVRRRARPDPRPRLHPGRRAHLLHPRADGRTSSTRCSPSCSTCCATTASTTSTSSCRPGTRRSSSAPTRTGSEATETLREAAERQDLELVLDPGGAAFYGPKISVQAKDAIGRTWQMSTIQVDFNLPERFELEYTAADGIRQRPVMIHRALFGSIERFFAVLLEHYAGAFPAWLAPCRWSASRSPTSTSTYLQEVAAAAARRRASASRSTPPTTGCRRRSATRRSRRCRSCSSPATRTSPPARCRSATATATQNNGVPVDDAVAEIVAAVRDRVQV